MWTYRIFPTKSSLPIGYNTFHFPCDVIRWKVFPLKIFPRKGHTHLTFMTCLSSLFFQRNENTATLTTSLLYSTHMGAPPVLDTQTLKSIRYTYQLLWLDARTVFTRFPEKSLKIPRLSEYKQENAIANEMDCPHWCVRARWTYEICGSKQSGKLHAVPAKFDVNTDKSCASSNFELNIRGMRPPWTNWARF